MTVVDVEFSDGWVKVHTYHRSHLEPASGDRVSVSKDSNTDEHGGNECTVVKVHGYYKPFADIRFPDGKVICYHHSRLSKVSEKPVPCCTVCGKTAHETWKVRESLRQYKRS